MKNPSLSSRARRRAFTLVELLVVITIIAALASLIFAVGPGIIEKARKVQAKAAMSGIETAINSYLVEYNRLPNPSAATTDTTIRTTEDLINILTATTGTGNASDANNPRKTVFLETKTASSGRGGIVTTATADAAMGALTDPWGVPYFVRLDYNYDDTITNDTGMPTPVGHTGDYRPLKIAIWSGGKDKLPGGANQKDDVYNY